MEVTHLIERKQIKEKFYTKSAKMKPYTLLNYKFSKIWDKNYTFSKQAY